MKRVDKEELRRLIEEAVDAVLARAIVDAVIARYNARPIKATAFFTGALLDIRYVMDAMRALQGDGFEIKAVLSKAAGRLIGVDAVKDALRTDEVYLEDQASGAVWAEAELILVPTLTVNTAAKVANCVSDTVIPDAISKSLMMGKLVIAAREGCCPECKQRMEKYAGKIPPAYAAALTANLQIMQKYGVIFTSAQNFEACVRQIAFKRLRSLGNMGTQETKRPAQAGGVIRGKKIIGLGDLNGIAPGGRAVVGKNAIVTQLAEDYAVKNGITIVRSRQSV